MALNKEQLTEAIMALNVNDFSRLYEPRFSLNGNEIVLDEANIDFDPYAYADALIDAYNELNKFYNS